MSWGERSLVALCHSGCGAVQPEGTPEPWELSHNTLYHTQPRSQCAASEQGAGTSELQGDHLLIPAQCAAGVAAVIPCILWDSRPDVQGTLSIPENPAADGREREK